MVSTLVLASPAAAHHPNHSGTASEAVRSLNSLAQSSGNAQNRVLVLQDVTRTTAIANPETTVRGLLMAELQVHPWFSLGGEAALWGIAVDDSAPVTGYGDTRVFARLTPHGDKLVHRVLTIGLAAALPTRTVSRPSDPGRPWSVTPHVLFSRTYARAFWQLMGLSTIETHTTGTAIDVTAAGQLGYRFFDVLSPSIGANIDVRTANWCDGSFCSEGRAGELDRQVGATRVYLLGGLGYQLAPWATLVSGIQVPLTTARDFDIGANLGVQYLF